MDIFDNLQTEARELLINHRNMDIFDNLQTEARELLINGKY
jgi:hypothetical protein